jgi:hypothetical protein
MKVISWPAQSPDINHIEHFWDFLKKKVKAIYPSNMKELKAIVS